jgi:hypothetical protein
MRDSGHYVTAENAGASALIANRTAIGIGRSSTDQLTGSAAARVS